MRGWYYVADNVARFLLDRAVGVEVELKDVVVESFLVGGCV